VTTPDRFTVGRAAVDHDPLRPAVPLECLAQQSLGSGEVSPLTEPEFDRVAMAVNGPGQIHPTPSNFDTSFVDLPLPADGSLASIEPVEELR
jgi:hypothetical protein